MRRTSAKKAESYNNVVRSLFAEKLETEHEEPESGKKERTDINISDEDINNSDSE